MKMKLPRRDPEAAHVRHALAKRRIGRQRCKSCGEDRPEALIAGSKPVICAACQRKQQGEPVEDQHHPAGVANDALTTIPVPVNDHRAELSTAQQDWPKETRENPRGSPLLKAAGCMRGYIDTLYNLIRRLLGWIPEMLEQLDALLTKRFGARWWERIGLAVPAY
jgi:hypothetical protein